MKIVIGYPPNIKKIQALFDLEGKHPVFAWGDTLYNPHGGQISMDIMVHERTHQLQQQDMAYKGFFGKILDRIFPDLKIKRWWKLYLSNPKFRIFEELEAYSYQYKAYCEVNRDRNKRANFLHRIATDLSGPMYGNVIGYSEVVRALRGGTKDIIN